MTAFWACKELGAALAQSFIMGERLREGGMAARPGGTMTMAGTARRPETLGELRKSAGFDARRAERTVKDEMRQNLLRAIESGEQLFPGVHGYDDTVIPQIVNAILARHNFILLGLRGQAKSRILRGLTQLLDAEIPVVAGCEINDSPFRPICRSCRELIAEKGDATPIAWLPRELRYVEKLATPDVTIADMIGDLDPIKAARSGRNLSDELTIHYGLLPRANRGIFAINELPDLAGKIQVGLFNIMQEGDVQIKGYPVRLPLDVLLVFTANPEDYTARGKIITPLKDRLGSEILTHYPHTVELGVAITRQEAWLERAGRPLRVPDFLIDLIERIAFEARTDKRVDKRSGVSQRLPISVLENVVSNAERRSTVTKEKAVVPRVSDVYAALPAITGKLELEYEGELQGAELIAKELIRRAAGGTFEARVGGANVDDIVQWFDEGGALKISVDERAEACLKGFSVVPGLLDLVEQVGLAGKKDPLTMVAACELVLEGLVAEKRISRSEELGYTRARPEPKGPSFGKGAAGPNLFT